MYTPAAFREDDPAELLTLMRAHSFATLVSVADDGAPVATHLPFQVDEGEDGGVLLRAHLARANPQWRPWSESGTTGEVLVIFQGPHAYISPNWYADPAANVPTWNYAAVHAYGTPRLLLEPELRAALADLTAQFEPATPGAAAWTPDAVPRNTLDRLLRGIVGVQITVTRLEGKAKLSQNKPEGDRRGVVAGLLSTDDPLSAATAAAMTTRLPAKPEG